MPGSRIPALTALSGANSANDDDIVIFDTSADTTKRISRSQLATGMVGDLPFTPAGTVTATTVLTAVTEIANALTSIPTLSSTSTLSNKTLSSPTLSGTVAGAASWSGQQTMTAGLVIQSVSPADLANVAHAINTTGKVKGKIVYDDTNGIIYVATGANAINSWYRADGGASIAPA